MTNSPLKRTLAHRLCLHVLAALAICAIRPAIHAQYYPDWISVSVVFDKSGYTPGEQGSFTMYVDCRNMHYNYQGWYDFFGAYPPVIASIDSHDTFLRNGTYIAPSVLAGHTQDGLFSPPSVYPDDPEKYGNKFMNFAPCDVLPSGLDSLSLFGAIVKYNFTISPSAPIGDTEYSYSGYHMYCTPGWTWWYNLPEEENNMEFSWLFAEFCGFLGCGAFFPLQSPEVV